MGTQETDTARARLRIGTVVRKKYRLDALIGVGGMAAVYKATHRNRAEFAIKMLFPELSRDSDVNARFLREGYAANSVKHPGVVRVVDDDLADDGSVFIVMELLDGVGVEDLCERLGGTMPAHYAIAIALQVLDVLAAAHAAGIVHRDIKPANLFVTREGVVKVLDFGIARVRDAAMSGPAATRSGMAFGTPAFMAPEQAMAKASLVDGQSDVWALGATLFTMISGELVHAKENAAQIMISAATQPARSLAAVAPNLPLAITSPVDHALAFDKEMRWTTAAEMRDALRAGFRVAFGEDAPSNIALAALVRSVAPPGARAIDDSEAATMPAQRPARGVTTAVPIASDVHGTRSRWRTIALSAVGGLVVLAAAVVGVGRWSATRDEAAYRAAPIVPPIPSAPPSVAPLPTLSASAADVEPEPPRGVAGPTASRAPARPAPSPAAAATHPATSARKPAPQCNPNYTLDADGNKHFKPECF